MGGPRLAASRCRADQRAPREVRGFGLSRVALHAVLHLMYSCISHVCALCLFLCSCACMIALACADAGLGSAANPGQCSVARGLGLTLIERCVRLRGGFKEGPQAPIMVACVCTYVVCLVSCWCVVVCCVLCVCVRYCRMRHLNRAQPQGAELTSVCCL